MYYSVILFYSYFVFTAFALYAEIYVRYRFNQQYHLCLYIFIFVHQPPPASRAVQFFVQNNHTPVKFSYKKMLLRFTQIV